MASGIASRNDWARKSTHWDQFNLGFAPEFIFTFSTYSELLIEAIETVRDNCQNINTMIGLCQYRERQSPLIRRQLVVWGRFP